uniref:Uncharacterized protein n=1 Tax=Oryza nivara TaxID=4536 RepID=A0A679BBT7_ORYNI|nr:hypothetical protein [Oryza sativa f. spontanea]
MAREQLDWQINSELNIGGEGEVKQEVERRKRGYGSRFLVALDVQGYAFSRIDDETKAV